MKCPRPAAYSVSACIKWYLHTLQCCGLVSMLNLRKFGPLRGTVVLQDLGNFMTSCLFK